MDIDQLKKCEEAFELEVSQMGFNLDKVWGTYENPYKEHDAKLAYELFKKGWQAKSQAVPDGFVLVPRELSADEARKHAEAMFNKVEHMARNEQRDLSESEFELFKNRWIDARTLTIQFDWKAMIEAQEQSHE
ncbi:hypothetical protein [Acinetobacter tandoii]|uniref:Uncharacterized protein n=1 Tax=Acinetobacter tandoii DSM 14970 = CIP 107469 TaxID=1120927 RepID=R9B134_9GAMM|nr:hypothetical protein [Acinetobacter tandoii]EOR08194.1 hypothetical protein I593_01549 [Acinetobacter tandoii DSM 14970 = CIP 107469]